MAALAGAAVIATQMVSSYWFYPYVCWWLPLVLLGAAAAARERPPGAHDSDSRSLNVSIDVARPSPSHSITRALDPHVPLGRLEARPAGRS